ncbi:phosphodiester glycosidase family protein, partial [Acinetobacter baumannii]
MTLAELADYMEGLGCVEALNLDGGGSSSISVLGLTLNRPSDGEERAVCNAFMLFGDVPPPSTGDMVVRGTPT